MAGARTKIGATALLCLLAISGCTSGSGGPSPSPTPTPSVITPTETDRERQERLDYAAAEKAYRTFRAEYGRVLRAGGAKEPTKVMKATAGGDYLSDFTEIVQAYAGLGARDVGRELIVYVRGSGHAAESLVLDVCEDGRGITTNTDGKKIRGELRIARLAVRKSGDSWKIWSGDGERVTSCD